MACASNTCLTRIELQTEPILPEGYGLMKALRALVEVLQDAFELQRACDHMLQRRRQRQALLELDDRLLKDIGLTREQLQREVRKWPWQ